jgi:hypothetical protein
VLETHYEYEIIDRFDPVHADGQTVHRVADG